MAHENSAGIAVESYIIDEITVNNTPLNNNQQQDSLLRSNADPSILGNSNLQANTVRVIECCCSFRNTRTNSLNKYSGLSVYLIIYHCR
jgi:hypothetical protein